MQTQQESGTVQSGTERPLWRATGQYPSYRTGISYVERSKGSVDFSRIGGDESKLRKHYGLTLDELANAERSPTRESTPSVNEAPLFVRPTESLDDLRILRSRPSTTLDHPGASARSGASSQLSDSNSSRRREPRKFSIRKVFGRNDHEQHVKSDNDNMVPAPDLDFMLDGTGTKRGVLPASQRRISIENRRYSATPPISPIPSVKNGITSAQGPTEGLAKVVEVLETSPARNRSSTVKTVQPAEAASKAEKRVSAHSLEAKPAVKVRPASRSSHHRPASAGRKHEPRRSVNDAIPPSTKRASGTIAVPVSVAAPLKDLVEQEHQPQSIDSNNSEGRHTLRATVEKRPRHAQSRSVTTNALPAPLTSDSVSLGDWTSATASRKAMEAISFFARLAELETRMASVERSLARLQRKEEPKKQQQHHRRSEDGTLDVNPGTEAHKKRTARGSPGKQPYLTPPSSQLSEQPGHAPDTWLDASSSVSSFEDSITASSLWHSSRTSEEGQKLSPITPSTACFPDDKPSTTHDNAQLKTLNYQSPIAAFVQEISSTASTTDSIEAMRTELAALRHDATQPSSVLSKAGAAAAAPTFTEPGPTGDEDTAPYEHIDDFDDSLLRDDRRASKGTDRYSADCKTRVAAWERVYYASARAGQDAGEDAQQHAAPPSLKAAWRRSAPLQSGTAAEFGIAM